MTFLVVGATGALGTSVVRLLRERGEPVRCLVRPGSDASALQALGGEIARGDLLDPESLRAACGDVRTVISTATAISRLLAGAKIPSLAAVDDTGVGALIAAAEQVGVERFVYVSYAGVDAGLGFPLERAKLASEQRLRRSSLRAVIVRPDGFQELQLSPTARFDVARGSVAIIGRGDTRRRFVSRDDVAMLLVALALDPDPPALVEVGGPDALSANETVELAERLSGRPLKRHRLPRPLVRIGMRVMSRPRPALASIFGIGLLIDTQEAHWDDRALVRYGISPRSIAEHLSLSSTPAAVPVTEIGPHASPS
jgi:uncharacterized protein YbjT (DUF2867 family)